MCRDDNMNRRLTRRFIINTMKNLNVSEPIRYERYYINNNLRIQKKKNIYEKETLNNNNIVIKKENINIDEFESLKKDSYKEIIRDSYLYLDDEKVSIKKYLGIYDGLIRVEVSFENELQMNNYQKLVWMKEEITNSPLAFDKDLSKLDKERFVEELNKYI